MGEEYSIITNGASSPAFLYPQSGSASMSWSRLSHAAGAMTRFKNPFTTLKSAIAVQFAFRYSPISCAVSSGFFFDVRNKGNTTRVRLPSKSLLVFCKATIFSGTSCPYNAFTAAMTPLVICPSMFISLPFGSLWSWFTVNSCFLFGCKITK